MAVSIPARAKGKVKSLAGSALVTAMLIWAAPASAADSDVPEFSGHWEGSIVLPGSPLNIMVDLSEDGGVWSGTIDIPAQSAQDLPLTGILVEGTEIRFAIANVPGEPTFKGSLVEGEIAGDFTQAGQKFSFLLGRGEVEKAARPQEPKPPFPYREEEVTYQSGDLTIAGTLTLPQGEGPFAGLLLISGSGPQNRDEEVFGHRPFLVIADYLTRRGVAVLRTDDRGVGGSSGNLSESTTSDLTDDALAGVRFLRRRPEIDPDRVGLLGHSEGGLIAPLAASRSDEVAFVILLAAPGVPGDEILRRQTELLFRTGSPSLDGLDNVLREHETLMGLIKEDAENSRIREQLAKMIDAQMAVQAGEGELPDQETREEIVDQQLEPLLSPWFRFFLSYDPTEALEKVHVPILVLAGELDLQVDPEQNLPPIRRALQKARNQDVTIHEFDGLNHLFQHAETGNPREYYSIEETIDPAVLELVGSWLSERF